MSAQFRGAVARNISLLFLAGSLAACSLVQDAKQSDLVDNVTNKPLTEKHNEADLQGTADKAFTTALSPLEDLGIRQRKIPDILLAIEDDPYAMPATLSCDGVKKEMGDIDAVLGVDQVTKPQAALTAVQEYANDGAEMAQDAVVGLVRGETNFIPMRSLVRRITGANKHEKEVNRAIAAGNMRRAYLRGVAEAKFGSKCLATRRIIADAEPTPLPKPAGTIEVAGK